MHVITRNHLNEFADKHPLASLMDVLGVLIENEDEKVPELSE